MQKSLCAVSVTGPIGCGKSELLRRLEQRYHLAQRSGQTLPYSLIFGLEPIGEWASQGWLSAFYEDNARWSFAFQMKVLDGQIKTMQELRKRAPDKPTFFVTERSPLDGLYVFCKLLIDTGKMTQREYELYASYAERSWFPELSFIVECEAEECLRRVRQRAIATSQAESVQDDDYFVSIVKQYQSAGQDFAQHSTVERLYNSTNNLAVIDELCAQVEARLATCTLEGSG